MEWNLLFFFNSTLLGIGLAIDAFSVSLANGLNEPGMRRKKLCEIAGIFAFFQALMPMIGWICVHTALQYFKIFENFIPWIALLLLLFIGGNMLLEGINAKETFNLTHWGLFPPGKSPSEKGMGRKSKEGNASKTEIGLTALLLQGVATSIDALSVGFAIAEYQLSMAIVCALIIAAVTFMICVAGLVIGKKFGTRFSNQAEVLGGAILIVIGIEIFITGIF